MAKLLDLDAIAPTKKEISLRGKIHALLPVTVGLFAMAQKFQAQGVETMSVTEQLKAGVDLVGALIPTMKKNDIESLTPDQIQQIVMFAFKEGEEINEKHAGEDAK
ncbi:hypothetical protein [Moellerella wisconsensis]|uniref:Uncharacterized protein n=1 Tax=Moellerella wisconsensis TaxID=158849 RepID=A0ACD3YCY4_9GAMM|nr:hypothetical protein [Moellerella wisconsensis]KLN95667.1 hypothetical protein VK86_14240 [Moellerella wisconsensis]UNH29293.1 hypothetical protein MNY64_17755 [Moellerella wisconsensis]UNH41007.1 hypothetical protein MNY70_18215 [Moellerella wisconsensis]WJW83869.1 hypothetical protein QU516_17160 [Moellerella wisconsensis]